MYTLTGYLWGFLISLFMKTKTVLLFLIVLFSGICRIHAQADFYLMQALGSRYIYNSDYFEETREMQVYLSGVDGSLKM